MNSKQMTVAVVAVLLVVAILVAMWGWRHAYKPRSQTRNETVSAQAAPKTADIAVKRGYHVVIETGELRMSNAVRCLAYIKDAADKMQNEQKRHFMAVAGVVFFDDCLMAKMKDGYIKTTTNELRAAFTNAVGQVFSNGLSEDVKNALNGPPSESTNWGAGLSSLYQHDHWMEEHPDAELVEGFYHAMHDRNNFAHMSVEGQYQYMEQDQQQALSLKQINAAIAQAGIEDAPQSDLKELCIAMGSMRTTMFLIYGEKEADTQMFQSYVGPLDAIFAWRLANVYQLDEQHSQALVQAMSLLRINEFSSAGAQPPAYIE
jgi:hypothetical protein